VPEQLFSVDHQLRSRTNAPFNAIFIVSMSFLLVRRNGICWNLTAARPYHH
jgi:hypothetical protein